MREDGDFKVALTTTGYAIITDGGNAATEIDIMLDEIPACVCELKSDFPQVLTKSYIARLKIAILNYLKLIEINSNLRSVFIGVDPEDDLTALVEINSYKDTPRINDFFKRWDETHTLMFQYTMRRESDGEVVVCMRTVYKGGTWQHTTFIKEPTLTVTTMDEFEK